MIRALIGDHGVAGRHVDEAGSHAGAAVEGDETVEAHADATEETAGLVAPAGAPPCVRASLRERGGDGHPSWDRDGHAVNGHHDELRHGRGSG
jgi:hypothetical protein